MPHLDADGAKVGPLEHGKRSADRVRNNPNEVGVDALASSYPTDHEGR
jgi:hypothetical protein